MADQADTSYRGGGSGGAPTTAGQAWSYAGTDADVLTQEDGATTDTSKGVYAKIIKINDDGSAQVELSNGQSQTMRSFNGMPVAIKQSKTTTPSGNPTGPMYTSQNGHTPSITGSDKTPPKSTTTDVWVPNPALPSLRTTKGAGGTNEVWFDYTAPPKNKMKLGEVIQGYASDAGSTDPAKKAEFDRMRQKLFDAGVVSAPLGSGYSSDFEKALDEALTDSTASGMTLDAYLDNKIKNGDGKKAQDPNGHAVQVTSKQDITKAVQDSATKILGYQPPRSMIDSLTAKYNGLESAAGRASIAASSAGMQGQTTDVAGAPSLDTFVEGELRQADPTASQGQQLGTLFSQFSSLLGGTQTAQFGENNG